MYSLKGDYILKNVNIGKEIFNQKKKMLKSYYQLMNVQVLLGINGELAFIH